MIHFVKSQGKFQPLSPSDLDKWNKIKESKVYCMRYRSDRNYEHHKKLFAIAQTIIANEPQESLWHEKEPIAFIKSTELILGFVKQIINFNGEITLEPESISFEEWGQERFEEFYNKAIDFWCEKFGYDRNILENNSNDYL
jgi:hypothetical protein